MKYHNYTLIQQAVIELLYYNKKTQLIIKKNITTFQFKNAKLLQKMKLNLYSITRK